MAEEFASIPGQPIDPSKLRLPRAIGFLRTVQESPHDTIVECLGLTTESDYFETIVADVGVACPQKTVHDIRLTERIAGRFSERDAWTPEALALRMTFPRVPHFNLSPFEFPKSLCLYADDWSNVRLRWHGKAFLERIREWLRLTARGELHQSDQPLEPLMLNSKYRVVLPHRWLAENKQGPLHLDLSLYDLLAPECVLIASNQDRDKDVRPEQRYLMLRVTTPAVTHGVIRKSPRTLGELAEFTDLDGFALLSTLREQFKGIESKPERERRFVLLVDFPKKRRADGPVESTERKAFLTLESVAAVGEQLGVWAKHDGKLGMIIGAPPSDEGNSVQIEAVMNVSETCTWEKLALLNGVAERNKIKIVSIGAGALGSQIACNLTRLGFGEWTVVDVDMFLPHNAARHALTALVTGWGKAFAVASEMNAYAPNDSEIAQGLLADVLNPRDRQGELDRAFGGADLILDMSASIAVARRVSKQSSVKRAASLFLNPSGADLVALVEDCKRVSPLNDLEMIYYWAAGSHPDLARHLGVNDDLLEMSGLHVRYGASCRDVSSLIPHDFVALHAANGARAIRRLIERDQASIEVYRYDAQDGHLSVVSVPVEPQCSCKLKDWEVRIAPEVLRTVEQNRKEALPNETGGVLIGGVDFDSSVIYVVGTLPAPDDSVQFPDGFVRGSKQLAKRLGELERRTLGNLGYLGEWHSHPNGAGTLPSAADRQLQDWIQENTVLDGRPAVMMIAGQRRECRIVVGSASQHKTVKCPNA